MYNIEPRTLSIGFAVNTCTSYSICVCGFVITVHKYPVHYKVNNYIHVYQRFFNDKNFMHVYIHYTYIIHMIKDLYDPAIYVFKYCLLHVCIWHNIYYIQNC